MNTPIDQRMEGSWKQFKGRLQEAWGALNDDDLDRYEGKRDQLVGAIEEKTGEAREKIRQRIDQFAAEMKYRLN